MHVLTLIAPPATALTETSLRRVETALHPDGIAWLAAEEAVDLTFAVAPVAADLTSVLAGAAIDAVVQPLDGRRKRLLVADMDGTVVTSETLDELAAYAGLKDAIAAITARSMKGEIDFRQALIERVAMLRGLPLDALRQTWDETRLTAGAIALVATMRASGAVCALVSGGFTYFTARVAAQARFDVHRANILIDDGHCLTGAVGEPILDRRAKRAVLRELAYAHGLSPTQTMAVGDGANDLDMIADAGLGVAFHAKPVVAAAAGARIDHCDLGALLFIQGYPKSAWVTA